MLSRQAYTSPWRQIGKPLLAEYRGRFAEQPAELGDRYRRRLMHFQVLVDEFSERDRRPSAARAEPIEHLAQRLLGLDTCRKATDLRPLRAASLEAIPVSPQHLAVRALRLQLEDLTLLDHLEPPRLNNGSRNLVQTTSQLERGRAHPFVF
jgi:hypothetical protein